MPEELKKKIADLETAVGVSIDKMAEKFISMTKAQAEVAKKLESFEAFFKMGDDEKEFASTLAEDERGRFQSLDGDKRKAYMKEKATKKSADPVDETVVLEGQTVSKKAVGEATFNVMKAQAARITKMEEDAEVAKAQVTAETVYKNLPGEPIAKAKALRAIAKLDKDARETIETLLKAGNEAMGKAFAVVGQGGGGDPAGPVAKLEQLAKAHAESNKVTYETAYAAVLKTAEGRALYNESDKIHKAAARAAA